jgi:hypothetical protein
VILLKNLKIEAILQSPISVTRDVINFDGLISICVANEMGLQDTKYNPEIKLKLPIEFDDEMQLYKASCGFYAGKESTEKWYKRWDSENENYLELNKKIETGRGKYKNYAMPIKIISTNKITFYARAEKKETQRLLTTHIHTIGKKSSQGYGIIKEWIITEIQHDNSFIFANGNLSRQIPFEDANKLLVCGNIKLDTKQSKVCTPTFPYWDISKQVKCFVPKVKFRTEKEMIQYIEG